MILLDILIVLLLLWSIFRGYKKGVVVQLGTLLGLFLGVYLAFALGDAMGKWLNIWGTLGQVVGFIAVFALVVIGLAFLGKLLSSVFSSVGLGVLNQGLGALLSLVKWTLIVSIAIFCFDMFNQKQQWVKQDTLDKSLLYAPMCKLTEMAFPYVEKTKNELYRRAEENQERFKNE